MFGSASRLFGAARALRGRAALAGASAVLASAGLATTAAFSLPAPPVKLDLDDRTASSLLMALKAKLEKPPPKYAFLLLKDHPYGREMLRQMMSEGFVPSIVVEEDSNIATEEREKFLKRIEGNDIAPPVEEQLRGHNVPIVQVPIHNSKNVVPHLWSANGGERLDLVVLGGTRIIRGEILTTPSTGVLNAHPGILPLCRGSASPAWSVYHDIPIGSTCHFCDAGIDTGNLVSKREVAVTRGMSYEDLCYRTLVLSGVLMKEALMAYVAGTLPAMRHAQGDSPWPTFKNAPPEVLEVVNQKLKEGTYKHYVD